MADEADPFRIDGKVALVTGCRRGIGRAMAAALARAGADVIGVSRAMEPSGSGVEEDVTAAGRRFAPYACDLSDRRALVDLIARVKAEQPPVDILVNNAGIVKRKPSVEHDDATWDEVLHVNLTAPFILSREFGREMVARGCGKIVFTASMMTFQGGITIPSYAASKGGIGQLTMALATEWASKGVNVNAIAPGYIATDTTRALQEDEVRAPAILARIPAGRWGTPADLAGATVFLCSPASDYLHGAILPVDGGWLAR